MRGLAKQQGLEFKVCNYHEAKLSGDTVEIRSLDEHRPGTRRSELRPAVIINATGAWVDETLASLHVSSRRLMGGTKGSHLFTFNSRLRNALAGQGIYAEARDGRPIFITPLADTILIGTTDVPFEGPPENAAATPAELGYLLDSVNAILPDARLTNADVDFHYSAVRPLPYVHASSPAGITRRHALVKHDNVAVPMFSVVGGKLTTMRSLAEMTATAVFEQLGHKVLANSEQRVVPGGEEYPEDDDDISAEWQSIAEQTGLPQLSVAAVWRLCGTRTEHILLGIPERGLLADSPLPRSFAPGRSDTSGPSRSPIWLNVV